MRDFANLHLDRWLSRITERAGLALLFAALLAFLAPFGTYRFGPVERVGYWTVQMAAWLVLSLAATWCVERLPGTRRRDAGLRRVAATLLATLPMMAFTGAANSMMTGWQPDAGELTELFLSIALIGGGYTMLGDLLIARTIHAQRPPEPAIVDPDRQEVSGGTAPSVAHPTDTALVDRLPAHLRADILCLQVEDHYVRVHARGGSAMVLMRFSDALRGIDHVPGAQVHRSWWVADDAVAGLRRTGRTAQLILSNGASVPVSQPYLAHAIRTWGSMEPRTA
jgi:hypothetical protein